MQSLVFVDQPEVAKLLMVALREAGFESTVVDDASCLVNTFGAQEHPALIVTSWGLSSLDGLAVCRQFREANPGRDTLVLILTGRMSPAELQAILDAGADDYVPFPIDPGVLHIRLRIISCRAQSRIKAVGVEQQLRQSVERFELAVAGARDGLWDSHPNGRPWNDPQNAAWHSARLKQSLGYSDEEFPPVIHSFTSRLHPDDKERVLNAMMEYIEHKQPYDIEYRLRAKSGEYIWFSARGQGVWDEQGRLMRMSGSLRDITQAKEYESKLEQSEARWRSLVENAPDIIILTDLEGTIQFINRDTAEAERAKGSSVYDYIQEPFWELTKKAYAALRATEAPQHFELRAHQEGGGTGWYATRLGPIRHDGKLEAVVLIATDITDRKMAEEQVQQSEAKWRSLVENAPDIIILNDRTGKIEFANRSTPGFKATVGRNVFDYIDRQYWDTARRAQEAVCTTGQPQQYEAMIHRPDGGTGWFATRLGPIWHNGHVESMVRIATDITPRKTAEEQLERERQSLRRLLDLQERERQLVAYDIHDGLVQYLTGGLMHLEASASNKTKTVKAESDYDRGMSLLRDAMAEARRLISGLRPPILDEQGVAAALEYLVNESRPEIPHVEFINHSYFGRLAAPLEVAIFRITQEALSNIRQHSHADHARVELLQHGPWVRLMIRDWGCGFDPKKMFEERFGLQGIRQRTRLLGTAATIESEPGKGTSIVIDFPLILEEIAAGS